MRWLPLITAPVLLALAAGGPRLAAPAPALELSSARSDPAAAVADGWLYAAGGRGWTGTSDVFEALRLSDGARRALAPLPRPLHGPGLVALEGRLYLVAGYTDWLRNVSRELHVYDPARDVWEARAPLPVARGEAAVVVQGGRIHVLGGRGADAGRVWSYLPRRDRWERAAGSLEPPRYLAAAAVLGGRVYLAGGRTAGAGDLARVDVWDPETGAWTRAADLPAPRAGLSLASAGGGLHATGGEAMASSRVFDAHWFYDAAADRWQLRGSVPQARRGQASVVAGAHWLLVGGSTRTGLLASGLSASARIDRIALETRP